MFGISVEVELEGVPADAVGQEPGVRPGDDLTVTLTAWWAANALEPFLQFPVNRRLSPIDVDMLLVGEPVTFGVRFDENLLADLLEAYAVHGWAAIEKVERRVAALGAIVRPTLDLVRATRNVIAVMVADALMRLEATATQFARQRWDASRRQLDAWLDRFTVYPQLHSFPVITDRKLSEQLVDQCHKYAKLRAETLALQEKIEERNRKAPPSRREKGSGADLWFELYATPQRKLLTQMTDQLALIGRTFAAAVLVLEDLPKEILDVHDPLRRQAASVALSRAIHARLSRLAEGLHTLTAALAKPPVTAVLAGVVNPVRAGDVSGLAALEPPEGGYEQQVMEAVFKRDKDDDQRLFADLGLLIALREGDTVEAGTMEAIALFRYVLRLADEVDRRRTTEEAWAKFWAVLEWIGAALGLIALMAFFPFGEAAAPALVAALNLAGTAAAVIGVVVLVLHQVLGAMQEAGELDRSARDQLFRLGQNDPEALGDIARALARSRALRDSVLQGAFLTVLSLGAAHKLKAIAVALEFQGFLGDLEAVFQPLEAAAGTDDESPNG